jgi:hypothetical protein
MIDRNSELYVESLQNNIEKPVKLQQKKVAICTYHAHIQQALKEIDRCMHRDDPKAMSDAIEWLVLATNAVGHAFRAGQAMEDRLVQYRQAIESLGFVKVKKK